MSNELLDLASVKQLCKKEGVQYRQFSNNHLRLIGGLAVDVWPNTGNCWVVGTDKSFKPASIRELFDVLNLKIFPLGVEWNKNKAVQSSYINVDHVCLICRKKMYKKKKSFTDSLIDRNNTDYEF